MSDAFNKIGSYMFKEDWERVPEAQRMKLEALLRTAAKAVDEIRPDPMRHPDKKQTIAALIEQADTCRYAVSQPSPTVILSGNPAEILLSMLLCSKCKEPVQGELFDSPE